MRTNESLERSLSPRQRTSRALVLGLDERHSHLDGIHSKEYRELRRRLREILAQNAEGGISAGDVVGDLYLMGFGEEPV